MRSFAAVPGGTNFAGLGGRHLACHQQLLTAEVLAWLSLPGRVPCLGKYGALATMLQALGSRVSTEGKTDGP